MNQSKKHITVGAAGLGCTILGVVLRAFSRDFSMQVVSRNGAVTVREQNPTVASFFTETGLALMLMGGALIFAATLVWMLKPQNNAEANAQPAEKV